MIKKLYIDDIREAPDASWTIVRTYDEAINLLDTEQFDVVSFDHDLGDTNIPERTGYTILMKVVQDKVDGKPVPKEFLVHSANPVGVERMLGVIERYLKQAMFTDLKDYWKDIHGVGKKRINLYKSAFRFLLESNINYTTGPFGDFLFKTEADRAIFLIMFGNNFKAEEAIKGQK